MLPAELRGSGMEPDFPGVHPADNTSWKRDAPPSQRLTFSRILVIDQQFDAAGMAFHCHLVKKGQPHLILVFVTWLG